MHMTTDERLPLEASVDEVWSAMNDVSSYQSWWPWLRTFEAESLSENAIWRCEVVAPMRYTVAFTLRFDVVVPGVHLETSVRGDIVGGAWIDLEERGDACDVWMRSTFVPASPFLKSLTRLLYPVAKFGHDTVIRTGVRQFQERALASAGARDTTK